MNHDSCQNKYFHFGPLRTPWLAIFEFEIFGSRRELLDLYSDGYDVQEKVS